MKKDKKLEEFKNRIIGMGNLEIWGINFPSWKKVFEENGFKWEKHWDSIMEDCYSDCQCSPKYLLIGEDIKDCYEIGLGHGIGVAQRFGPPKRPSENFDGFEGYCLKWLLYGDKEALGVIHNMFYAWMAILNQINKKQEKEDELEEIKLEKQEKREIRK